MIGVVSIATMARILQLIDSIDLGVGRMPEAGPESPA
jgi:hypothetical protein